MFFTYLRRELRRRMRQAIVIALGLALGVGLVITVAAASAGVQNSQAAVLHSLYGVGTDVTVTRAPARGSNPATVFGFRQDIQAVRRGQIAAGTKISINNLANSQYGTLSTGSVATVARQHDVTSAAGGLTLTDVTVTGTVPSISAGGGSYSSSFTTGSFTVEGVDPAHPALGSLSSAKLTSGAALTAADATADDALVDSGYAAQNKLATGSTVAVGGTNFKVIGIVSVPQGSSPPDIYIPLAKAQAIGKTGSSSLKNEVNTIYVSAASAGDIPAVQNEIAAVLPHATITDASDLAHQVTGSLTSTASLANDLGRWLSVLVLVAAFAMASLLTTAAVARRVREFGTLKALGWPTRRIIGQVMGESITIGILGGVAGAGLGYAWRGPDRRAGAQAVRDRRAGQHRGGRRSRGAAQRQRRAEGAEQHQPHGLSHPDRSCRGQRDPARRAAGHRRRAGGRLVRRLAGGPAAPGGGAGPSGMRDAMYRLTGVVKNYTKGHTAIAALRGVDLIIGDGEWLAIQGPTGHGKSTLLQIIGGLDRPTSGTVEFGGADLGRLREAKVTRVRAKSIGFIFQTFNLIPTLSARENVETALVPLRIGAAERKARSEQALAAVGLGDRLRHLPSELSGGQQQRVAVARALVKQPAVLLADEPTGNLDEDTRDEIIGLLQRLWQERGLTMVLVTHDSAVAARAQRVGLMRNGLLTVAQPANQPPG